MRTAKHIIGIALLTVLLPIVVNGGLLISNLVTFNCTNGSGPAAPIVFANDGYFYGVTVDGNPSGACLGGGSFFRLSPSGALTNLAFFQSTNGFHPHGLVQAPDGRFYGTTTHGGSNSLGTVYYFSPSNTIVTIAHFDGANGLEPYAGMVVGGDGDLYGSTDYGGLGPHNGVLYKVAQGTNFSAVHYFNGTNGLQPFALTTGPDGNIYGGTAVGGTNIDEAHPGGFGTAFRFGTNGTFTSLASFAGTNGYYAGGKIAFDDEGNLYSSTVVGGIGFDDTHVGYGTLFKLNTSGELTTLYRFTGGADGSWVWSGLIRGPDNLFYGSTSSGGTHGYGTLFSISADGVFKTIHSFTNYASAYYSIFHSDGCLYGVSEDGGTFNKGFIVRFSIPMSPVIQSAQKVGGTIELTWSSVAGQTYQLQYTVALSSTNWIDLGLPTIATNGTMTATDSAVSDSYKFYRVALLP